MKTPLLRHLAFTFCFSLFTLSLHSQWVSIPDTNFVNWLNTNGYSSCMNGSQMDTVCSAGVTFSYIVGMVNTNIQNLYGLQFLSGIDSLYITNIYMDSTTVLPPGLIFLNCSNSASGISNLPVLPTGLRYLDCSYNGLTQLPPLPNGLIYLDCSANHSLHSLPALPDSLKVLRCSYDSLTSLPVLPGNLNLLSCEQNQLTSLPLLPKSLRNLIASYNQLSSVPELSDTLFFCYLHDNLPLQCLPKLKWIWSLTFSNTSVACVPNTGGDVLQSVPPLNSLPLCDVGNANGCHFYWNVRGRVYDDTNLNCALDSNEVVSSSIAVKFYKNGILAGQTYTVGGGYYTLETGRGTFTYSVDTSNLPVSVGCPSSGFRTTVVNDVDSFVRDMDFGMRCKPGIDVGAWSVVNDSGMFRPFGICKMQINAGDFYGLNCAAGTSGQVKVIISGATYMNKVSGALTPVVSDDTLTYNISDFGAVNELTDFRFLVQTQPGSNHVGFTVIVTSNVPDINPTNNIITNWFLVRNSNDPNDKQVYPFADIDTAQEWLTYTVRFQNTGTAEAQYIYITDTLDNDLDASSFQLLAYSHQSLVLIKENSVRFDFPNINLPDSNTNEPLSHGYVQYKIKLKDNLPIGTEINNTAFIYFDFNAPVVTNTTTNTIAVISGIQSAIDNPQFAIYPNPASDAVTISVDEEMIGSSATVTDITGRKMAAVNLESRSSKLEAQNFGNGVYFVAVMDKEGRSTTKKLVIQK